MKRPKWLTMPFFWKQTKIFPYLRKTIASLYYFYHKTRREVCGNDNVIDIHFHGYFPLLKNVAFNIVGNNNTIIIKSGVCISDTKIEIKGEHNKLVIEENCHIGGGCLWIEDYECQLSIGKGTTIIEADIGVSEPKLSVTIGEDCMLAHGIDIRCGDSHSVIDLESNERINYAQNINIGDHVWIATFAQVLKGVNIGNNSIIAAGSIVTKDVPENCLVSGIPADVKRTKVTWVREKILSQNDRYISENLKKGNTNEIL